MVVAVVVTTGALAFAAGRFTSPEQRAARDRPPAPTELTVPIQRRNLTETLVGRFTVAGAITQTITLPSGAGSDRPVVTSAPLTAGSELVHGAVVAHVAGQPVIAFEGPFNPYRDLRQADTGPDVELVQRNLAAMGFNVRVSGVLDAATERGLRSLMGRLGARPPAPASPTVAEDGTASRPDPMVLLPAGRWIAVADLPARVAATTIVVGGDLATEPATITAASGPLVLATRLPVDAGDRIGPGMSASVAFDDGSAATGSVVTASPSGPTADGRDELWTIAIDPAPDPARNGAAGRVEVALAQAPEALTVPIAALDRDAEGATAVVVVEGRERRTVRVTVGVQVDGWVELEDPDPALSPGVRVLLHA